MRTTRVFETGISADSEFYAEKMLNALEQVKRMVDPIEWNGATIRTRHASGADYVYDIVVPDVEKVPAPSVSKGTWS